MTSLGMPIAIMFVFFASAGLYVAIKFAGTRKIKDLRERVRKRMEWTIVSAFIAFEAALMGFALTGALA